MTPLPRLFVLLLLLVGIVACSRPPRSGAGGGGHVHTAPHGGTLVEIGQHAYNLEIVRDAEAGKLTAYVLDGHAENFVRIDAPAIELVAFAGGERRSLTLHAVANPMTGETVGNTSQFEGQAEWLKKTREFAGTIPALSIRGATFRDVALHVNR